MTLHGLRKDDITALRGWLPAAASAAGRERWANANAWQPVDGSRVLIYCDHAGEAFLAYEVDTPVRHAASIDLLAVPPEQRRLGIGGRAAIALEKRLGASATHMYVAVPSSIGLALYFWLRLGYRPLMQHEWPRPLDGTSTWMVRPLR